MIKGKEGLGISDSIMSKIARSHEHQREFFSPATKFSSLFLEEMRSLQERWSLWWRENSTHDIYTIKEP